MSLSPEGCLDDSPVVGTIDGLNEELDDHIDASYSNDSLFDDYGDLTMNRSKMTTLIFISHCILGPRLQHVVLFVPLCSSVQHIYYCILQLQGFLGFLSSCVLHQTICLEVFIVF